MKEKDEFLKEFDTQTTEDDLLDQPLVTEEPKVVELDDENTDEVGEVKPKTRRERRLVRKLQSERESSIFLAGKLQAREEADKVLSTEEADYLKALEHVYGNDTPEKQLATDLLKKAITGARDDAEARAFKRFVEERDRERAEEKQAADQLDGFVEEIEDEYNVSLSETQQRGFFQLLQKMSPKDREGNVTEYADPHAVWEVYQERTKRTPDNRAKALSARSMTQSGASSASNPNDEATIRMLNENGIIL